MWLLLVPVCLVIFSSSPILASEPHYVIIVPANLQQGTNEKVCVTFLDLKGKVDIKLELKKDDHAHPVATDNITSHDYSNCYDFQVPLIKEDRSFWRLHVSAHGEHINVDESKKVVIFKVNDVCIIQTDRSAYKPGDVVQFHVMTVNRDFQAITKKYPSVEIIDPNQQHIGQWLDVSTTQGFAEFSFHLANELAIGDYRIDIPNGCHKSFKVESYTRKRFELNIKTPSDVALTDKSFHLDACGSYIYGKPVEGSIDLSVCAEENYPTWHTYRHTDSSEEEDKSKCITIKKEKTDSKGCVSRDIQLGHFNFSNTKHHPYLEIKSELTEDGTGHSEKASFNLYLSSASNTIEFVECENIYQTGFPYHGKIKINNEKKHPMANQAVFLYIRRYDDTDNNSTLINLVTDSNGITEFTVKTVDWKSLIVLRARLSPDDDDDDDYYHRLPEQYLYISPIYSKSGSLLSIQGHSKDVGCYSEQSVTVEYDIHKNNLASDTDHLHFLYVLLTKNGIYSHKKHDIDVKDQANSPNLHGSFTLKFHVHEDFFPAFNLLVYSVLPNGETIARTTDYNVSPCIRKMMNLRFSEDQVRPGEHVNLEVTADPGSLCSVRSVDKGFLLEMPHDDSYMLRDITALLKDSIYSYQFTHLTVEPDVHQCPEDTTPMTDDEHIDVDHLLRRIDLHLFSNTDTKVPMKCVPHGVSARRLTTEKTKHKDETPKPFTRSYFPDTWVFKLVPVGSDGHSVLNLTAPHSITKWVTDAFCLDKTGVADVKDVEFTTFQPYFTDLIVPYSVVQGEKFTIQAVVFSYVRKCIMIAVSLSKSEDLVPAQDMVQTECVCEKHSHSFSWDVSALKPKELKIHVDSGSLELEGGCTQDHLEIGEDHRKDSVEKTVVVKPKGYEDENTKSFLLFPSDNREAIAFNIDTPERLVPHSERAHVIILGDLLANVAVNLDHLPFMPDGCGEQNAAKIARYACTLDYLESIKELKPEIKSSAIEILLEGYQKQLTFRNKNGSYVLFPGSEENIWLTAFTVNALSDAKKYIYVNDDHIQQAVNWLHTQQLPDGCFKQVDSYFNNYMEADDEIARTAYITIALMEHHAVHNGTMVQDAVSYLKKSAVNARMSRNLALLAYVFALSGNYELRDEMLTKLEEKAIKKEGTKHWETSSYTEGEVEMASYVIMALLYEKPTTIKNLEECGDIVRWVVAHQNPWGGFFSSQDSTIALQALAMYAQAIQHKKGDSTVTISSKSGFQKIVHVDKRNSLLVQTVDLPEIPGEYTASVTGDGYVYVQSHVHYYALPKHNDKEYFSVNVSTEPSACTHASQKKFDVHVDARYTGQREHTNMAIITLETPSGYVPDKDSAKKLEKNPLVKRTEITEQNITIYLDELTHETKSFVFTLEQDLHIENLQPANIIVYDYYDPDEYTVVDYSTPCSSYVAHCAVDAATREDCGFPNISKDECEKRGCCFDSSISGTKWCFSKGFKKAENH